MVAPKRYDVFLVNLDPILGHEIRKMRPAVVISPDEMNRNLQTAIIAPMTTKGFAAATRIPVTFQKKRGFIILDQMRSVDRLRLLKKLGVLHKEYWPSLRETLQEMFE